MCLNAYFAYQGYYREYRKLSQIKLKLNKKDRDISRSDKVLRSSAFRYGGVGKVVYGGNVRLGVSDNDVCIRSAPVGDLMV